MQRCKTADVVIVRLTVNEAAAPFVIDKDDADRIALSMLELSARLRQLADIADDVGCILARVAA